MEMKKLYFSHCPNETDDPATDACRGCVGYSLYPEPECGAVWKRAGDDSVAPHTEVRDFLRAKVAALGPSKAEPVIHEEDHDGCCYNPGGD